MIKKIFGNQISSNSFRNLRNRKESAGEGRSVSYPQVGFVLFFYFDLFQNYLGQPFRATLMSAGPLHCDLLVKSALSSLLMSTPKTMTNSYMMNIFNWLTL